MVRKFPVGAEVQPSGGVHFRVWAPESKSVSVELDGASTAKSSFLLQIEANGYFSGLVSEASSGAHYKFRLDSGAYPDPASRFQPEGPHGPSEVVDPARFRWTDKSWVSLPARDLVIYELHLGTFTPQGTWNAAMEQLPELKRIGITVLEIMPIADFPGRFGWGYDGVNLFAPCRLYGTPEDVRHFVNRAHELGLMVILDVVYNHFGPDGNYLPAFSKDYFSTKYKCEWGQPLNFEGRNSAAVREYFITNARYWITEFHFDGFRFDATQAIFDETEPHILAEISDAARKAAGDRPIYLVAENEPQRSMLVRSIDREGCGLDALWNDDFHHTAMVAATGKREAYYLDYRGKPQEFISALKYGFLFQGQVYSWQKDRRGKPSLDLCARNFVVFLQNHDQVANSLRSARLNQLASPPLLRALTALTLLSPCTPMLFQGDEFGASTPFHFFADHNAGLNKLVKTGRDEFMSQFRSIAMSDSFPLLADPAAPGTFELSRLQFSERERNKPLYQLHEDLLRLRRVDLTIRDPKSFDGAVLDDEAFVLRYFSTSGDDRILMINLGRELHLNPCPEPLVAPIENHGWRTLWTSEDPRYGGAGTPALETSNNWILPAYSAILLMPDENTKLPTARLSQEN